MGRTHCSPDAEARRSALALHLAPGVGPAKRRELIARYGSASQALDATQPPATRDELRRQADERLAQAESLGATALAATDIHYPDALRQLDDPPWFLFARGVLGLVTRRAIAIVGTRSATPYGVRVARALATGLAQSGIVIVSGMARGIDAAAHRAALDGGGGTVGVLGTGIDIVYPKAHRQLQEEVGTQGLLLTEELPGDRADGGSFPRRNRIIAALAEVTLVVEAGVRSGALITATHALELGRTVAAVPGPIDSPNSAGANALIRDGAMVITELRDVLDLFGMHTAANVSAPPADPRERIVWEALAHGAADADAIAARTDLPAAACLAALSALELAGRIECTFTGEFRRR